MLKINLERSGKDTLSRGVEVPVPQHSVPREYETRLKMLFMHFRMRYYLNATYLCFLNKSLWVPGFSRTGNTPRFPGTEPETDTPHSITVIFYPYNQPLCRRNIKTFTRASCTQKFTEIALVFIVETSVTILKSFI